MMSIWDAGVRRMGEKAKAAAVTAPPPDIRRCDAIPRIHPGRPEHRVPAAGPGDVREDATQAGVLLATGGVKPPAEATKVKYADGEFTVLDGPFSEAKELIGGWALMEVRDKAEAIEWTKRFLTIAGGGESTLREVEGG
jgi:hypothetical protein